MTCQSALALEDDVAPHASYLTRRAFTYRLHRLTPASPAGAGRRRRHGARGLHPRSRGRLCRQACMPQAPLLPLAPAGFPADHRHQPQSRVALSPSPTSSSSSEAAADAAAAATRTHAPPTHASTHTIRRVRGTGKMEMGSSDHVCSRHWFDKATLDRALAPARAPRRARGWPPWT